MDKALDSDSKDQGFESLSAFMAFVIKIFLGYKNFWDWYGFDDLIFFFMQAELFQLVNLDNTNKCNKKLIFKSKNSGICLDFWYYLINIV